MRGGEPALDAASAWIAASGRKAMDFRLNCGPAVAESPQFPTNVQGPPNLPCLRFRKRVIYPKPKGSHPFAEPGIHGFGGQQMKIRKLNAATALGSLTASVALLAGMQGAHAQGAPGAGSFPGSFLVPGTQTSFKVGGYIKFDYTYDFGQVMNINGGASPFGLCMDA